MTRDAALLLLGALAVAHVAVFGGWLVEDAAISFAYARNWADGHGLVPFVGGERVEGYSNFLWVALLALAELVGVDAVHASKGLSFALVAGTVPLVYRLGERAAGVQAGLAAATAFAVDTQVAIFGAAGLENPLFSFLLALGLVLADNEARTGRPPASALVFLGVALTRPEGILYAAVAGALSLRERRGLRSVALWLAAFFVPFAAYHAVRYAYFAWPFPMTFYAKVDDDPGRMLDWGSRGWTYLAGFVTDLWRAPFLALAVLGLLGAARWRWAALAVAAGVVLAFAPPIVRPVGFAVLGVAVLAMGLRSDRVRTSAAAMGLVAAAFAVYADGDWMGGYRWLSFATVPFAVLLGAALGDLAGLLPPRASAAGPAGCAAVLVTLLAANASYTRDFLANPEISPYMVRARVAAAVDRTTRLGVDERPRVLTVDVGGFLYWSDMEILDLVGLVDVTFARHGGAVLQEVAGEERPHYLVVGSQWADRLEKSPWAEEAYAPLHGNFTFVRRDLLFSTDWPGEPGRAVVFERGLSLGGVDVPSPEVAAAGGLYVEVGLGSEEGLPFTARLLLADAGGTPVASWPIQPLYGWMSPSELRPGEWFHGRYTLALPPHLPEGTYALGVRLVADGEAVPALDVPPSAEESEGTVWFPGLVRVVSPVEARAAADADLRVARAAAAEGRCAEAWDAWRAARAHLPADRAFADAERAEMEHRLAGCFVLRADADPDGAVEALEQARRLDPDAPGLAERVDALADRRYAEGMALRAEAKWRRAYTAFSDAVRLDPSRAWARRYAEEARAVRLKRGRRARDD